MTFDLLGARGGEGERKKPAPEVSELKPNDVVQGRRLEGNTRPACRILVRS